MHEIGSVSGPVPVRCEEGNVLIQSRTTWDQNGFDWQGNGFESFKRGFGAEKGKWGRGERPHSWLQLGGSVIEFHTPRSGNYWLGLERLHTLTSRGHDGRGQGQTWELVIELWTEGEDRYLTRVYSNFSVGDEASGFRLSLGCAGRGNLSDSLVGQSGSRFLISGDGGGEEHIGANDILTSDRQPCDNGIRVSESPNKLIFLSLIIFSLRHEIWLGTLSRSYLGTFLGMLKEMWRGKKGRKRAIYTAS